MGAEIKVHSKICSITHVATKVHVLTWMRDTKELVYHVTLWNLNSLTSHLRWCGPLQLAFLGDAAYACTNIQQVA